MSKRDKLAEEVRSAFEDVPYPGDDNLTHYQDWEPQDVAAVLKGRDWRELRSADLLTLSSGLSFITAEAFRYYLPALLLTMIDDPIDEGTAPTSNHAAVGYTLFALEPIAAGEIFSGDFAKRVALLSRQQRAAVRDVIEHRFQTFPERLKRLQSEEQKDREAEMLAFWERAAQEAEE